MTLGSRVLLLCLAACVAAGVVFVGDKAWQRAAASYEASAADDPDPFFHKRDLRCDPSWSTWYHWADGSSYEIEIGAAMKLDSCIHLTAKPIADMVWTTHVVFVNHLSQPATVCVGRDLACSPAHPEFQLLVPPGERVTMGLPLPTVRKRGHEFVISRAYPIVILAPGLTAETMVKNIVPDGSI
ncbi:hypothetical protein [Nocardia sp. NPDC058705]|uniref:hypothetical protein n=1 Tax=Nocardia sp. NPDC058705 TaxID=3346609 RepID=UPI00369AE758